MLPPKPDASPLPPVDGPGPSAAGWTLALGGLSCAACALRVERALRALPEVAAVAVNPVNDQARVEAGAGQALGLAALVGAVERAGYEVLGSTVLAAAPQASASAPAGLPARQAHPGLETQAVPAGPAGQAEPPGQASQAPQAKQPPLPDPGLADPAAAPRDAARIDAALAAQARAEAAPAASRQAAQRRDTWATALALLLTLPLLLPMLAMPFGLHAMPPAGVQAVLASAVLFGPGARFFRAGWAALRAGSGNMDLLVALGSTAAWGLSMGLWWGGETEALYFESAAVIVALVRLGKALEGRAKQRTSQALRALATLRPTRARRLLDDGREQDAPVEALRVGDRLRVRPGERLPADGLLLAGRSHLDESALSGESLPVARGPGERVRAGTLNGEGVLELRVTAVGAETTLARIVRLVETAQAAKPPVQHLVDRVSAVFVPAVLGLALLGGLAWLLAGAAPATALLHAVAVLVVACPCALGLATPMALMAGTGVAARHGLLIRDVAALEAAPTIRVVAFDKTGTLTLGQPSLAGLHAAPDVPPGDLLRLAAALQQGSEHPLARALARAAQDGAAGVGPLAAPLPQPQAVRALPGRGLEGWIDGRLLRLGSPRLAQETGLDTTPLDAAAARETAAGRSLAWVMAIEPAAGFDTAAGSGRAGPDHAVPAPARDTANAASVVAAGAACARPRLLGLLSFGDRVRPEAAEAVQRLRARGLHTVMLSGDHAASAEALARQLGLDGCESGLLPADKAQAIARLRAAHGPVAMVGDGLNDAPALAAADLGLAIGGGTDLAMETAGITLMQGDPRRVADALDLARRTRRTLVQNLGWAFGYNLIALPLALAGQLSPALAGAAMACSSLGVVANAWRLQRWRPASGETAA